MGLLTGDALFSVALAVAVFLLLVDLMHRWQRWAARYPPGPVPVPGLGNLLQVDFEDMAYSCYKVGELVVESSKDQLQQRFGDVFSLQFAWTPVVVVNGVKAVREALVNHGEDTSDRPTLPSSTLLGFGPKSQGVFGAYYGPAWREQRRFSVSTLRNFGVGKKSLEQWVTEEAACLCAAFANHAGQPFCPKALLNKAVCNVISSLIYARRFDYDDPMVLRLLEFLEDSLREDFSLKIQVVNSMPLLLRIPWVAAKVLPAQRSFMALNNELLAEHNTGWAPDQPPRDLTDAFLTEMHKAQGNSESTFNDQNLRLLLFELFVAGMGTSAVTLSWALLLMILHPDVQRRVQQEIDEVIGQGRRPEMEDQARMPFTNAVIHEVQRFADIVPMGVPHMTSRDTEVQGFLIPKGTTLLANLSSVLKDETVWEKPLHFHPGHFLDAEGRFVKREAFMPFSAGPRICLGEPLARMVLFLFFTSLLQHFSFSVPEGQPRPSDRGVPAFVVTPSPYQLCAVLR
ncbi:cytochrome P450 2D16-like isoform X1 [Cavia porcellus]|uniref:cytochrome P450 2D16-like isoform X1 n=1 Tax=Cavia porcellus TaxID=10141 RepID=UPI002FE354CB